MTVIVKMNVAKLLLDEAGADQEEFQFSKLNIEVSLPDDKKLQDAVAEDPKLHEHMVFAATDVIRGDVKTAAKRLEVYVRAMEIQSMPVHNIETAVNRVIEAVVEEIKPRAARAIQGEWDKFRKTHVDYMKYKIKIVVRTSISSCKIVVSAGMMALGGLSFGIATAVGIYSLTKSMSNHLQDLAKTALKAEEIHEELGPLLQKLAKKYRDQGPRTKGAKEALLTLWKTLTSHEAASISKCKKLYELLKSKTQGIEVESHKVSKGLHHLLEKQMPFERELNHKIDLLKAKGKSPAVAELLMRGEKIHKDCEHFRKGVSNLIDAVSEMIKRIDKMHKAVKEYHEQIGDLTADEPRWAKVLQHGIPLLDVAIVTSWANLATKVTFAAANEVTNTKLFDKGVTALAKKLA